MITKERLNWINKHRIRGDVGVVVAALNASGRDVTAVEARSILIGTLVGEHGAAVVDEMETIIKKRIAIVNKQKLKYA